jgi:hypothetical protein
MAQQSDGLIGSQRAHRAYRYHVLFAMFSAFIIVYGTHLATGKLSLWDPSSSESTLQKTFKGDSIGLSLISWGVLFTVVFSMSTFDTTASLASAMAWLILISVILINADVILKITGSYNAKVSAPSGSPIVNNATGFVTGKQP